MDENIGFLKKHKMFKMYGKIPYITGTVNAGGQEFEIAIWGPKEGKNTFFAKLTPKEEEGQEGESKEQEENKPVPKKTVVPEKQKPQNPTSLFK